ncbi:MAG: hypothetical protein AAF772_09625, partial [Acidobacteriota bacterium]
MTYRGNPSLNEEVKGRITTTFSQTVELVKNGRDQEAVLGCEFILGMDPLFQPARVLLDRLKTGARPVTVDDLLGDGPIDEGGALDGLDDLDALDDLDDLDSLDDFDNLDDLAEPAEPSTGGLAAVLSDLLARGNAQQVLQIAQSQQDAIARDPALAALVERARAAHRASPAAAAAPPSRDTRPMPTTAAAAPGAGTRPIPVTDDMLTLDVDEAPLQLDDAPAAAAPAAVTPAIAAEDLMVDDFGDEPEPE